MPKVIAGSLRGRALKAPKGRRTRPTSSRVREAIFDVLNHHPTHGRDLDGARVLDLYAGAGGLGIEALSRGAAEAHFVERDRAALAVLRDNLAALGLSDRSTVWPVDAERSISKLAEGGHRFDLVLLDPPYAAGPATARVLAALRSAALVAPGGVVVWERATDDNDDPGAAGPGTPLVRRWGETEAVFYNHD